MKENGASLLSDCEVLRIEADASAVKKVICLHRGKELRLRARIVVLAAGALHTPRILLRSANHSGKVGQNLMRHYIDLFVIFTKNRQLPQDPSKELGMDSLHLWEGKPAGVLQSFGKMPPAHLLLADIQDTIGKNRGKVAAFLFGILARVMSPIMGSILSRGLVIASVLEDFPFPENRVLPPEGPEVAPAISYEVRPSERSRIQAIRERIRPWNLECLPGATFLKTLKTGEPPFRLSLPVSAAQEKIPLATLTNVHWSPFWKRQNYPLPDVSAIPLRFLGPVIWSPTVDQDTNWKEEFFLNKPMVYVGMGSSGQIELLPKLLKTLCNLPITVVLSTAGRVELAQIPENCKVFSFLPGSEVAARAIAVICNGGTPSTQQSLLEGTPVIGITSNLDQCLAMEMVEKHGAGIQLRSDAPDWKRLRKFIQRLIEEGENAPEKMTARKLSTVLKSTDATTNFRLFVEGFHPKA